MKKEILRMQGVSAGAYEPYGLNDFRLFLRQGEIVKLMGLSGSGKTALYQLFLGYIPLREGTVTCNGQNIQAGGRFTADMDIVCIGQHSTLVPTLSVAENILIINRRRKNRRLVWMPHINYRARILLSQYAPEIEPTMLPGELTNAQRRIVELLRAIESEAKLVIVDNAFDGFGQSDMLRIIDILRRLREKGIGLIYESHGRDAVDRIIDRLMVLRKGRIIRTFYAQDFDETLCMRLLTGNEELPAFERKNVSQEEIVMELQGVSGERYIKNVNLSIRRGEIVGIYDLDNHRNMELLGIVSGQCVKASGKIYLLGELYEPRNIDYAISCNIGFYAGNTSAAGLVGNINLSDNLNLPVMKKISYLKAFRNKRAEQYLSREYMKELGVPAEEKDILAEEFGEGIQKRLLMKRWVLSKPTVMVCMEPFMGMDVILRDAMLKTLSELAENHSAVLLASQDMNELKMICDTIYVLNGHEGGTMATYRIRE